ncbi:MAG: nucleotidyltransferase family protein [Bdellovibrionota bacterium]
MIRKAILLAAGRGERMGSLTDHQPKPLIPISGKPLMQYGIELLASHGVDHIGVNVSYHAEKIKTYFGGGSRFGLKLEYVDEHELTGTAGGMRKVAAAMALSEPFFVLSADMLVNFDLRAVAEAHRVSEGIATLCCYFRPRDQLKKSGVILFDESTKKILRFVERPQTDSEIVSQWVSSSVYAFSPEILSFVSPKDEGSPVVDLPRDVFPKVLASSKKIFAFPVDGAKFYQLGIDTPDRIARAEQDIASGRFRTVTGRETEGH